MGVPNMRVPLSGFGFGGTDALDQFSVDRCRSGVVCICGAGGMGNGAIRLAIL